MTATARLVVELFTEELPPKALRSLGDAFASVLHAGLAQRGFLSGDSTCEGFATPRRLAVSITAVAAQAADSEIREKLVPRSVAEGKDGKPTVALVKRLEKLGRGHLAEGYPDVWDGPDHLYVESDGKADYVWLRRIAKGQSLVQGLQESLEEAVAKLPIPKVMSYAQPGSAIEPAGYFSTIRFVRPAHRLLALHGADVVAVEVLGLRADRLTDGHRFLSRKAIAIASADAYEPELEAEGKVVPSFGKRRAAIAAALARAAQGAHVIMPDALLDEVTSLVEWPAVYAGTFDPAFLEVPQECLILTMQQNQKYFALADASGRLTHRFLLVSNLATENPAAIVQGNERVLRARLADARFFFQQDRKASLESRLPKLDSVVYQAKIGTQAARVERLVRLAGVIAGQLQAPASEAERAARLAKADLVTDMVGEFPELQGTMGRYYALHDGAPARIADAIAQHYWPRFAGDTLPADGVAQAVALADKLESLAGMFGIGAVPTGDKDPFGLRRAALGVLRILIEQRLPLSLHDLVAQAFGTFAAVPAVQDARPDVLAFLYDRLRGYLRDQGFSAHQIAAVVDDAPADVHLVPARLAAVQAFEALPEAASLSAANKRIVNILRKSGAEAAAAVDRGRLAEGAERDLFMAFQTLEPAVQRHCAGGDYKAALLALAEARPVVDRFFDDVMVMADDPVLRANRLALLRGVAATMNRVADISKLAV